MISRACSLVPGGPFGGGFHPGRRGAARRRDCWALPERVCLCKQDAVNDSAAGAGRRTQFGLMIYWTFCFCSNRFSCLCSPNDCIASHAPCSAKSVCVPPHNMRCAEVLSKRFPVSVSLLAPEALRKSQKELLSMHKPEQKQSPTSHWQFQNFQCP